MMTLNILVNYLVPSLPLMVAADEVVTSRANRVSVGAAASISPQALGAAALTGARLDNACHDVVRIVGAGPVARRASIRGTPPAVPADARVEADAITTPVVGAAAPNCGES